jgi:hypothetical protein
MQEDGSRVQHRLAATGWFCNRFREQACDLTKILFEKCGSQKASDDRHVAACCLVRIGLGKAVHHSGMMTQWSPEAQLLWDYYGNPVDAYSLEVIDVKPCCEKEPLAQCWVSEQRARTRRIKDDAAIGDARCRTMSPSCPLCVADWAGVAGEIALLNARSGQWIWRGEVAGNRCVAGGDLGDALLSDSDAPMSDSGFLSSGSDQAAALRPTASRALEEWHLELDANIIPALLVPEPITFLIARGKWTQLLLLTSWHSSLRDRKTQRF